MLNNNKNNEFIYFDTAATTRVAPAVVTAMTEQLASSHDFANPSSAVHAAGRAACARVEQARAEIAGELGCEPDEVVFTSGATEANNLALRGIAQSYSEFGRHLITSRIEHKAVLGCCEALGQEGFEITRLAPNARGWVEPEAIAEALRPDTLLISLMHTNNETGVMQPIAEVADLAAERGVLLHVDAAQAAGKFRIDLERTPIDLLSLSAHKFHGPKGIGCLVVRNRRKLRLQPLMHGGGQEHGLRPGTLATHQIIGLAAALRLAAQQREADLAHVSTLRRHFIERLSAEFSVTVHGDPRRASPYIVNFSIPGISSDALINRLADRIAIASGSACSSGALEPSYVLRAMGVEGDALYGAVRLSFDRKHSLDQVTTAVERIAIAVQSMQELSTQ